MLAYVERFKLVLSNVAGASLFVDGEIPNVGSTVVIDGNIRVQVESALRRSERSQESSRTPRRFICRVWLRCDETVFRNRPMMFPVRCGVSDIRGN